MPDTYEDKITDPRCLRMRAASGRVDDFRPLVAFLYELARDHVTTGTLEGFLDRVATISAPDEKGEQGPAQFTNGWLARWAQDAADRLLVEDFGRELRLLRSAVTRIVKEVEGSHAITAGSLVVLLPSEADVVRIALAANEPF